MPTGHGRHRETLGFGDTRASVTAPARTLGWQLERTRCHPQLLHGHSATGQAGKAGREPWVTSPAAAPAFSSPDPAAFWENFIIYPTQLLPNPG